MHYFAGLFDAEGYISLCHNGAFTIAVEMANEEIPNLLKKEFQGSIYERKRDKRKKTWIWKINSISEQALFFIKSIKNSSIIKIDQLIELEDYINNPRNIKRSIRENVIHNLKFHKRPSNLHLIDILPRVQKSIEPDFFKWLAGFIDGDGNFVCNEYIDNRNGRKYFSRQISIANIILEVIQHINDRIPGCISHLNHGAHIIFKWTCKRHSEKFLCESIHPFLKLKKDQCRLFLEFLKFPEKTRNIPYSIQDRDRMYSIINQIKHLNSL